MGFQLPPSTGFLAGFRKTTNPTQKKQNLKTTPLWVEVLLLQQAFWWKVLVFGGWDLRSKVAPTGHLFGGFGQWEFLRSTQTQPLSWTQKPGTWMLASKATRKIHPQNLSKYETPNQCGKKKTVLCQKKTKNRFFTNHFYTVGFHLPNKKRKVLEAPIQSYHQIFKVPNRKVEMKTSKMSF